MSQLTLESGLARATIMPERGALISELQLLDRFGKPQRVLWLPQDFSATSSATWPGGGLPFLFPFAGRVWHGDEVLKYAIAGHVYDMPLHGFAWASAWTLAAKTPQSVRLHLKSDDASKSFYPFEFEVTMTVTLSAHTLHVAIAVTHTTMAAKTREKMPVAFGWHPYFAIYGTSRVTIPADTVYPVTPIGNSGDPQSSGEVLGAHPWNLPHPALGSLILGSLTEEASRLELGSHALSMSSGPEDVMQHIVTWTNQPSEFICIEPWMSLPDAVFKTAGCRWLKPGESLSAWLSLECR